MKKDDDPLFVARRLSALLKKYDVKNNLSLSAVKKWIYNERGKKLEDINRLQKKFLSCFLKAESIDEIEEIMQCFTAAWNAFPHSTLRGKSPNDLVREALKKHPDTVKTDDAKMPEMIVGGEKMPWDEYWKMIQEMKRRQIPFKNWTEKEVLPKYKKYLESMASQKEKEQHYQVADIFFDRVRHVGFLELAMIRKEFIQIEFPYWWQTHVMDSNLSEQQIRLSLKSLFQFLGLVYEIPIKKFGF
ncbi:MAG: hypothetical protein V1838_02630 [Patescibacteria group bacterium]